MAVSLKEKIKSNILIDENGCWLWQRHIQPNGYGRTSIQVNGRQKFLFAHRVSYESFIGEIPENLQIDHLCRRRSCVNPKHLEPVTGKENKHRSSLKDRWALLRSKAHCLRGHAYTTDNTLLKPNPDGNTYRNCRKCHAIREAKRYTNAKFAKRAI